jgi:hypothetical protein
VARSRRVLITSPCRLSRILFSHRISIVIARLWARTLASLSVTLARHTITHTTTQDNTLSTLQPIRPANRSSIHALRASMAPDNSVLRTHDPLHRPTVVVTSQMHQSKHHTGMARDAGCWQETRPSDGTEARALNIVPHIGPLGNQSRGDVRRVLVPTSLVIRGPRLRRIRGAGKLRHRRRAPHMTCQHVGVLTNGRREVLGAHRAIYCACVASTRHPSRGPRAGAGASVSVASRANARWRNVPQRAPLPLPAPGVPDGVPEYPGGQPASSCGTPLGWRTGSAGYAKLGWPKAGGAYACACASGYG